MNTIKPNSFDRVNAVVAAVVFLTTLVVYLLTQAPTLSLWDCGEFIATSVILGIPHPPGTPMYVMVGRLFSMFPFFEEISVRINFLSGLSSAVASTFAYLSAVRLLRPWFKTELNVMDRFLVYSGAASGAFLLAFGKTAWANAVETEVYGLAMMIVFIIIWLSLKYLEVRETRVGGRIMLTIIYLAFMGIGVHMTTLIVLPVCGLLFIMKKETPNHVWFILASFIAVELFLVVAFSSRPGELPWGLPVAIALILYLFYVLSFDRIPRGLLLIGTGLALSSLSLLGLVQPTFSGALNLVGALVFIATLSMAVYLFFTSRGNKNSMGVTSSQAIVSLALVACTAIMVILLLMNVNGYAAFLFLTILALVVTASLIWKYVSLSMFIAFTGMLLVILGMKEFAFGLVVAAVILVAFGLMGKLTGWKTACMALFVAVAGFSVHLFIPIRSSMQPFINENNPSTGLTATINFIERKQYGSQSMIERMFKRRAEWKHQFGFYQRMGFWSFFEEQYGSGGKKFFLIVVIGLFGIWELVRRKPPAGLLIALLILLTSVGLILYMNFADGTRMTPQGRDYLEVRDRDYFFTPAFMLFGLVVGIGLTAFVQFVRESFARNSSALRVVIPGAAMLLFLLPVYTVASNLHRSDRSNNWIPYEYAWNLLQTVDKNGVLFTNGDNDTFPLWCLQEAYKIRKDVRIVNLSLANTKWYIKQIRDYMKLKLGWTDRQIDDLRGYRLQDGRTFRVQDQVIDAIIANNPDVPINYSVTVSSSARKHQGKQIDSTLTLAGMKFRYSPESTRMGVDTDECLSFFLDTAMFKYKGLSNHEIYLDDASRRVVGNVANSLLMAAEGLRQEKEFEGAKELILIALSMRSGYSPALGSLAGLYVELGQADSIKTIADRFPGADMRQISLNVAQSYRRKEQPEEAFIILDQLLIDNPAYRPAFVEMMKLLMKKKDPELMVRILKRWVDANPDDSRSVKALSDLQRQLDQVSGGNSGKP